MAIASGKRASAEVAVEMAIKALAQLLGFPVR
jgi:hypothetical protein